MHQTKKTKTNHTAKIGILIFSIFDQKSKKQQNIRVGIIHEANKQSLPDSETTFSFFFHIVLLGAGFDITMHINDNASPYSSALSSPSI